jgi:transglutaminase-like putative cysteine protease
VDLHAVEFETVELASGLTRLLRIDSTSHHGGSTTRQTLWCDGAGEVIRSFESTMNLTSERTTREVAQWKAPAPQYDIMTGSRVPVEPAIENPRSQAQLVYQVQLRDHSPAEAFARDDRQQVEPLDHRRALLTVHAAWLAAGKDVALPAEAQQPAASHANPISHPEAQTLAPSRFIQSGDPQIVALAGRVLAGQDDPSVQQLAVGLERLVHDWIDEKSYQQIFASAREVYHSHRGDCTEHAVLLAALCRARKIPARLALGLVYVPEQQGFLFHLWTEGWWDNRWHGLDATLGRGGIGATHLKLRAFTLADDNLLAEMATVSQVIGQLEIRVVTKKVDD